MNLATLAERNLVEFGEYDRLVFEDRAYTNRELHEESCRLASALVELGLAPGDRVIVMMANHPDVFVSYPAIWRVGLVAIPVLFVLDAQEVGYILRDSGAKAIITSSDLHAKALEATRVASVAPHIIVSGRESPAGALSLRALVSDHEPISAAVDRAEADLAVILYTSGTTGRPKGVMLTHDNLYQNSMNAWNTAADKKRIDTSVLVLPLAHSFGLGALVSGYLFGGRGVLMRWFNPEETLALIQKHCVTQMAGVPTMFLYMLNHPNAEKYDTSSVRRWLVGAAPMPHQALTRFEEKFGGTMYVGYGLSEASPGIAVEREGMKRKAGSTGVALEGVEIAIVDDSGNQIPRGQIGEIIARGRNVSPGYYGMEEATRQTFRGGWLFTGDMGYLDEEGYLFIVERKKDLIIRGGLNVYPKDIEELLYTHPGVLEAAVVGVEDELMGEEVCAFVVRRPGVEVTPQDILALCQANLAKYKTPRHVDFLPTLPRTTIGKVLKKELRKLANEKFGH